MSLTKSFRREMQNFLRKLDFGKDKVGELSLRMNSFYFTLVLFSNDLDIWAHDHDIVQYAISVQDNDQYLPVLNEEIALEEQT